jgi:H+/Cl- antiporter ClcA
LSLLKLGVKKIPLKNPIDVDPLVKAAFDREKWWSRLSFWAAALILGLVSVFFAAICDWSNHVFQEIYAFSPFAPFLVCPLGFLLVIMIQRRFFPGAEGSGTPQVIASLQSGSTLLKNKLLSIRILCGKILGAFLGLLFGASIGREGPSIHIGASLFHALGHFAQFSRADRRRGLIVAGAAAGLSAAFNAPLAGIVFAIEELKGSFEDRSSGLMLSAIILAGLISLALLGHYTYFGEVDVALKGLESGLVIIVISVMGGLSGGLFSRMILYWSPIFQGWQKKRWWLVPIVLGLVIAAIGFASNGQSFGTGYEQTRALLDDSEVSKSLFPFWKFLATFFSYMTGIAGGVFAPSLSIGASLGTLVAPLFPLEEIKALIVLGMVAFLAAVIRAPITSFVIVFEMTSNHFLLLPLMACSFISAGVSKLVSEKPLYRGLADQYLKQE